MGRTLSLDDAGDALRWLQSPHALRLDDVDGAGVYVLVALATLARQSGAQRREVIVGAGPFSRFAQALGFEDVVAGVEGHGAREPHRTVELTHLRWDARVDPVGVSIARLMSGASNGQTFDGLKHVVVELLRNAAQHSGDKGGAVVAAQVSEQGGVPWVQVAVGDAGIGVYQHLSYFHRDLTSVQEALEKALHPHYSGAFAEGQSGTDENAGLGLFVTSELAKVTGGRLLLASRGDALLVRAQQQPQFLDHGGFPGTLVAFECPLLALRDFSTLFAEIIAKAEARTPKRASSGVVSFDEAPPAVLRLLVQVASEDTVEARRYAAETLIPRLIEGESFLLDFRGWEVCSQSYLHALLYKTIRMAWASQKKIYVTNAAPAVKSGILWVESYALGG